MNRKFSGCTAALLCGLASGAWAVEGGRSDPRDGAVGIVWDGSLGYCTGTLVASDVVLTAAHCTCNGIVAFFTGHGRPQALSSTPPAGLTRHNVTSLATMTGWGGCPIVTSPPATAAQQQAWVNNWCGNGDVALLRLQAPIRGVAPIGFAARNQYRVGNKCSDVGFGFHTSGHGSGATRQLGSKRRAHERISSLFANNVTLQVRWRTGVNAVGDSGGPLYCGDRIAGISSCTTMSGSPRAWTAWYTRGDAAQSWVQTQIAAWHPAAAAAHH
jgi:hypothetical protein